MAKELIAYAASDLHFHDWKQFNEQDERTQVTINVLAHLMFLSDQDDVPIIMPGDLFHTPKGLTTKTLVMFMTFMNTAIEAYPRAKVIGITGNHDGDINYSLWYAMCKAFPTMLLNADNSRVELGKDIHVYGLPYRRRNNGLVDAIKAAGKMDGKKILLLHTELYGAPDPSGYDLNPQNFPRESLALFKAFNLVLAGHVHKHTKVKKNVYMVGAPNQQRKSDAGCEMGYLEIYDDFSVEFMKMDNPEFRFYKEGEEHEDTNDFWVEIPKPKKMRKNSEAEFKATMDKTKMAKQYAKETGIKSKRRIKALIDILEQTDD